MKILIIEDEIKSAKNLITTIEKLLPNKTILKHIDSVSQAIEYLQANINPDVIFMDIQLADGPCFEIFSKVKINAPVIFCTAFDEYAIEAFKCNGIDYILKPFEEKDIALTLQKIEGFKIFFQQNLSESNPFEHILHRLIIQKEKSNFLVFNNNKYSNVPTNQIAYFYSQYGGTFLVTFDQKKHALSQSLEKLVN